MSRVAKGWRTPNRENNNNATHQETKTIQAEEATTAVMEDVAVEDVVVVDGDADTKEHHAKSSAGTAERVDTWHMNAQRQRRSRAVHPQ